MFRNIKLGFVGSLMSIALAVACGSSSGGSSTPPGTYCDETVAGDEICFGYTNLTADQTNALTQECTSAGYKTVSTCPGGDIGCCAYTTSGYNVNECYYQGDTSAYQSACKSQNGTWTAGSGGDGGSSSGGDGGGSSSGSSSGGDAGKGKDSGGSSSGGDGGSCKAPDKECSGMCVNEQTDAKNCGKCGNACKKGMTCKAGKCA